MRPSAAAEPPSTPVKASPPAKTRPRRKPWLKHQSDVRSLIFLATHFALMAVQWRHDAALFASGPLGWLACLTLWLAQLWFAAIAAVVVGGMGAAAVAMAVAVAVAVTCMSAALATAPM